MKKIKLPSDFDCLLYSHERVREMKRVFVLLSPQLNIHQANLERHYCAQYHQNLVKHLSHYFRPESKILIFSN
jgi:hypothetical protein